MTTTIFSPQQLQQIVADTLSTANVPAGHRNVILGAVDKNGAKVVAGFSLGAKHEWTCSGAFIHDWAGDNHVGAQVLYSF